MAPVWARNPLRRKVRRSAAKLPAPSPVVTSWVYTSHTIPWLGALPLAYYDPEGRLVYASRPGTGIKQAELGAVVAQARRLLLGGPAFRSPSPQRRDAPSLSANYEPEFARQLVASEGLTKKFQRFRQSVLYRES
jgi:hypothetical protein